jgi:outer membrane protein OmpA-like peptidoglycan-associated protein
MEVKINFFSKSALTLPAFLLLSFLFLMLTGCASSGVQRGAASQVDSAYESSNDYLNHVGDGSPDNAYQNASQTTKGIIIGSATGSVAGGLMGGSAGLLPGAAAGATLGAVLGAYVDYHTNIVDQLENRGVKVIILGDQVLLVTASKPIFRGRSAELRPEAYSTLDLIGQFIHHYATMSVKISTFTNDMGNSSVSCYLTQQQADKIKRYLWPITNTRLLYAEGFGGTKLIEKNNLQWDGGANYRIEISFEKLPV